MADQVVHLLKLWRQATDAATEGPWAAWEPGYEVQAGPNGRIASVTYGSDAMYIATARTAMPALLNAVEAVRKLHRINGENDGVCQGYTEQGYGYLDVWCVECSEQSGREYGTEWPCLTVTAIRDALGGAE